MRRLCSILKYIFLSIASFVSIFPFIWMIIGATNTSKDVTLGKLTVGNQFMVNFNNLIAQTNLSQAFLNSLIIAVITTVVALFLTSMAGYAFYVYKTKMLDRIFGILMLSMMIPFAAVMIPLFRMISGMGILDSYIGVILPSTVTAFLIFFFRQNTETFPQDLLAAGRVDGLGELGIFFSIYMPSMKSTYAAAAIITFMASWNSYLWPLISLQSNEKKTLPLLISYVASAYQPDYGVIMMLIIIATLPTLLIFFLMQKHFVEGMVGSIK